MVYAHTSRCFTRLTCGHYSFAIWVKFLESTMIGDGYGVFTSGGVGNILHAHGALALFVKSGELAFRLKINVSNDDVNYYKWKASTLVGEKKDQWLHLMGTWSADGEAKLYINGAEVASAGVTYFLRTVEPGSKIGMQNFLTIFFVGHIHMS